MLVFNREHIIKIYQIFSFIITLILAFCVNYSVFHSPKDTKKNEISRNENCFYSSGCFVRISIAFLLGCITAEGSFIKLGLF